MPHPFDRRQHPRVRLQIPVSFYFVFESICGDFLELTEDSLQAESLNISENGICLTLKKKTLNPNLLRLRFNVPSDVAIDLYAQRMWDDGKIFGFKFIVINEADQLLIKSLLIN